MGHHATAILAVAVVLITIGIIGGILRERETAPATYRDDSRGGDVVCTMEAKQCPDGSYVGRGGPNCEFAACPAGSGAL